MIIQAPEGTDDRVISRVVNAIRKDKGESFRSVREEQQRVMIKIGGDGSTINVLMGRKIRSEPIFPLSVVVDKLEIKDL